METIVAVVVGLLLIWLSIKIVKFIFKLILLTLAVVILVGALGYYNNWWLSTPEKVNKTTKTQSR